MTSVQRRVVATSKTSLLDLFRVETGDADLVQAQVVALSTRLPLLFFITVVNTLAVAYAHYSAAPGYLTIGFSTVVTIGYAWRGWYWVRVGRRRLSDAEAGGLLKLTAILGPICSAIIVTWALSLYRYGDAFAQSQLIFYFGVTLVSCVFCMMHLRAAALLMTGVTVIPFAIFFLTTGRPVFIAGVLSMLLISAAMIYILLVFSRDFARMIEFQVGLVEGQLENSRLANTDSLTGLPNRRQFMSALEKALETAKRDERRLGIGLIDLDGFRLINDLHGRAAGDKVLVEAARRLGCFGDDIALLARLGGDEFAIIVDRDLSDAEFEALGVRVCKVLKAPFASPAVVDISGSIGFANFPNAGSSADLLFERADYALYHARRHQRGRPLVFSIEHETEIRRLATLEQCLRHADLQSEMSLHFQPIFDVDLGKPVAFEALARWVSPALGRVPPDVFIRVAEQSDLINILTTTLLRRALAEARGWPNEIRVSFNLSVCDLASREAMSNIVDIIEQSGLAANRIDLEVTETGLIQDFAQARSSLRTLKALGVGISLDDFGTGYSSLSYLRRFPIDKIKVDRSFISELESDAPCRAIVKSVIDMTRNLELACIVEGVETDNQVSVLRSLGCAMMQGYFFGRPMPGADVMDFLRSARVGDLRTARVRALAS